jgi:hypothetical protein
MCASCPRLTAAFKIVKERAPDFRVFASYPSSIILDPTSDSSFTQNRLLSNFPSASSVSSCSNLCFFVASLFTPAPAIAFPPKTPHTRRAF